MDRITEGFLTEFSNEFGIMELPEKDRFEQFCGWLVVRRHYKPEPYYVAALALYRLEQLFKSKKIDTKYKSARYQLLLVVRMLIDTSPLPKMNSSEMTKRSLTMAEHLQDEDGCEKIFNNAIQVIESLETNWGRDTIRNEPITKAIFQKYGQHYPG